MNSLTLSLASIRNRTLQSFLCILAVACGIALLHAVFLLFSATEGGLMKNAQGVDIVVGAKGSPLQLVLSTVYHGDIPTGNIDMTDMEKIAKNPQVKSIIPMAIGDNFKGFRVVGTSPDYVRLYNGDVAEGKMFANPYEVTVGSSVKVSVGNEFAARHGFSADSDDVHDDHLYHVVGRLKPTGTVLDKLILTPYQSVQDLHSHADDEEDGSFAHQVTALLIKVKTPAAMMNLPRAINGNEHVMAVVPSHVMSRVMKNAGLGRDGVILLGSAFLVLSMLMLFSALASGLSQRKYDFALMRVLGASPSTLVVTMLCEALILSGIGSLAGLVAGHGIAYGVSSLAPSLQSLFLPSSLLLPGAADLFFMVAGMACGAVAGIVPCIMAARIDTASILAQGR